MTLEAVKYLCKEAKIDFPENIEVREPFWYVKKAAQLGGIAVYKKYGIIGGNPEYRKQQWHAWWNRVGKPKNRHLPIQYPLRSSLLAEWVGIMLGDGGVSKMQVTITLHRRDDREYIYFVTKLIRELFGVIPGLYNKKGDAAMDIVVSRVSLVEFCTKRLGLVRGSKTRQQVDIPYWVKKERQYYVSCVRGLIDTDGSVFTHRYKVKNKEYQYKKIIFTNRSAPLLQSVFLILKKEGLHPRKTNQAVYIESQHDVSYYMKSIGSHNPKHLQRYQTSL
ncbi:MAG: LAGLIDADG family homing endonuclease [Parcubacteria group bacterium]|nr:LAGLIDADG family homing endonuclease [Parcubacteria group bacterium]